MGSEELQAWADRKECVGEVSQSLGATALYAEQVGEAQGGEELVASCGD